ncbi:MAG: aminotransferase class V-fold PLP-dependent enzyme [Pseudanabaenaceae cyanobacterium SKYGB_i_bin29]|nr:aminotransferase class V-fold PLP-dependent enzyme [Pseudanabaenaceae cyanobacterium SKYG29]MDW8422332.1 aminotransferase class V-fold PLP-dependent enzyme [Pseudanabaenaceae cyanobacterium SKYGB_i_bin29]
MADQQEAPILAILDRYFRQPPTAFYFPGHRGKGYDPFLSHLWGGGLWRSDVPELPGVEAAIEEAESLAADLVGAQRSWFLTNGATIGIQAMFLAFPGAKILVGRNCHRSTIGGMVLAGTVPVYLATELDTTGVDLGVSPSTLEVALQQHPDTQAVFLVSPNYYGVCGEVEQWVRLCHDQGIPLLLDSAHGAHLGFHPGFPPAPLSLGADLVVQSTHKTAVSLTQTAILHLKSDLIGGETIDRALSLLKSTSPSLPLLASIDSSRRLLATEGQFLLEKVLTWSEKLKARVDWLTSFDDPSRITAIPPTGTGFDLDQWLCHQSPPLIAELPTLQHLVFALTIGTEVEDIDRLITLLQEYPMPCRKITIPPYDFSSIQQPVLTPRQAYFAPKETVAPPAAIGRISGSIICPYPPGIPVILPGEIVEKETIAYLEAVVAAGGIIPGWEKGIEVLVGAE